MEKFTRNFLWLVLLPGLACAQMGFGMWLYSKGWHFREYLTMTSYATFFLPFAIRLGWSKGLIFCFNYAILGILLALFAFALSSYLPIPARFQMLAIGLSFVLCIWAMSVFGGRVFEREISKTKELPKFPDLTVIAPLSIIGFVSTALVFELSGIGLLSLALIWTGTAALGAWEIGPKRLSAVFIETLRSGAFLWIFAFGAGMGEHPNYSFFLLVALHWSIIVSEKYAKEKADVGRSSVS